MAWEEPKTNWQAADVVIKDDFNRIEGNAQHLKDAKADKTEFNLHVNNENNPHNVTASQVGAAPSSHTHDNRYYTESEVDTKIAAKVDKPASAVSGNIAVFDGGAGKLKDGGKKIEDLMSAVASPGTVPIYTDLTGTKIKMDPYHEVKACIVYVQGAIRVKFDFASPDGQNIQARIYKNGVAVGTVRSTTSATFTTFTEDIANVSVGDRISIYGNNTVGSGSIAVAIKNFIVLVDGPIYSAKEERTKV